MALGYRIPLPLLSGLQRQVFSTVFIYGCQVRPQSLFVWRSLLTARDVLRVGSMWKIGDGQSIKITSNKWLPHPPLFKPGANTTLTVGDLIHHESMQCNRPLIQATFMQATQNDILNLQLSNTRTRDKLYWRENKAQQFTVKTAYQVALRLHREMGVEQ